MPAVSRNERAAATVTCPTAVITRHPIASRDGLGINPSYALRIQRMQHTMSHRARPHPIPNTHSLKFSPSQNVEACRRRRRRHHHPHRPRPARSRRRKRTPGTYAQPCPSEPRQRDLRPRLWRLGGRRGARGGPGDGNGAEGRNALGSLEDDVDGSCGGGVEVGW